MFDSIFPLQYYPNVFSYFDFQFSKQLEEFKSVLKSTLYLKFQTREYQDLINLCWVEIRDQACRNAGLECWGEHVLRHRNQLKEEIQRVIEAIDSKGYLPWIRDNHPNRVSEVLDHVFYPTPSLPQFTWD